MKPVSIILLFGLISVMGACTYPSRTIEQGGNMVTGIYFEGAPAGARLMLDGADAGEAAAFDGSAAILAVSPGTHNVVVTAGGREIYNEQVYVGSGSRVSIRVQ
jgi:hypothetical protein